MLLPPPTELSEPTSVFSLNDANTANLATHSSRLWMCLPSSPDLEYAKTGCDLLLQHLPHFLRKCHTPRRNKINVCWTVIHMGIWQIKNIFEISISWLIRHKIRKVDAWRIPNSESSPKCIIMCGAAGIFILSLWKYNQSYTDQKNHSLHSSQPPGRLY